MSRDRCRTCERPLDEEWVVYVPVSRALADSLRGEGLTTRYPVNLRLAADDVLVVAELRPLHESQT